MPPIPFLDLVSLHRELKNDLLAVLEQAIDTAVYSGGPMVTNFEEEFAQFCNTKYCVAVNSGTDALRFAYIAGGIRPGDEVITVPNTFIATTEAISQAGAYIVFVDIDERTYNMDPAKLRAFLESNCEKVKKEDYRRGRGEKADSAENFVGSIDNHQSQTINKTSGRPVTAVAPVHLFGQPADMDAILAIAAEWNLMVFEDACQAHGAEYYSKQRNQWRKVGSIGKAAAFSFYPGKNLGALGEGGAITTNEAELAGICRMLRDHGQARKYYHDIEGYNSRPAAIQCGFLSVKLKKLPEWNKARQRHAAQYNSLLSPIPEITIPFEPEWSKGVYHLYVIRVKDRDKIHKKLAEKGISTALHYPVPLHWQKAYANDGRSNGSFPVTERAAREILSLPMFPHLTEEQIRIVAETIKEVQVASNK